MLALAKNRIQPKVIAAIIALLVGGTYIIDRIIGFIIAPCWREYYDTRFVKKTIPPDSIEIAQLALILQTYHIIVFHLLVLIATLMVFFHQKFKPHKRELLFAYITIAVVDIAWVAVHRLWIDPS